MDTVLALGVKEASSLACEGTALLMTERPLDAISKFNCGLEVLRVVVGGTYESHYKSTTDAERSRTAPVHEFIQAKVPGLADERFYVFDFAMLYAEDNGGQIDHGTAIVRCAAVIFNLALCFHKLGKATKSEDALRSSINLYRTCAQLLLTTEDAQECSLVALFTMAAFNNEACLHFDLGCPEEYYRIQAEISRAANATRKEWSPAQQQLVKEFHINFAVTESCAPAAGTA